MREKLWKYAAVALAMALLLTLGVLVGVLVGRGTTQQPSLAERAASAASPTAESSSSPIPTPTPTATPVATPTPAVPAPPPPPSKPRFVLITSDWQHCYHSEQPVVPPICLGHGVFQNVGATAGGVPVTFVSPDNSTSCTTTVPVTPPGSSSEASCDLGYEGQHYWGHQSQNTLKPPTVRIANP